MLHFLLDAILSLMNCVHDVSLDTAAVHVNTALWRRKLICGSTACIGVFSRVTAFSNSFI